MPQQPTAGFEYGWVRGVGSTGFAAGTLAGYAAGGFVLWRFRTPAPAGLPDKLSTDQPDDDQNIKRVKADGRNDEKVHGRDVRCVVAQKVHQPWDGGLRGAPHSGLSKLIR